MDHETRRLKAALADRYAIERELGAGGMATVYLAQDLKHRRKVAIKVLQPELAASVGAERFLREIEIAAGLTHPHILALHDSGEAAGFLYYVMPYVEGQTLRQRMVQSQLADGMPLPVEEALRIARGVAEALDYAHRRNIIHRDIKPENIMLVEDHPVVADFGIARAVSAAGGATLTQAGRPIGTPMYMSPEQSMGAADLDGRSDIYSLGLVLYEMLVGEVPRTPADRRSIEERRFTTASPEHRRRLEALPRQVLEVLARAMAEDPERRFATAAEFAGALPGSPGPGPLVRRPWWRLAAAGAAVVAAIAAALVFGPRSSAVPDRIMVAPFENQTGDTALAPLGLIVADWLTRGLQETGMIQVVDARSISSSRAPAGGNRADGATRALTAATNVGAGYVVSGAYYLNRDTLRIQARLTEAPTGVVLLAVDPVHGPRDAPLGAVELLGQRVLGAVASLSDATWPTTSIRPPTYPAYREYVTAGPLIGRLDYQGAVTHFLRAAALDSTFTMPLIYAAVLMMEVDLFARADSLYALVDRSRSRLGVSDLRMADYLGARLRGDFAAGLEALRPVAQVAPLSEAPWEVGQLLMRLNRPREAIDVYQELDPTQGFLENWWFYWNQLCGAYHMLGEHDAELRMARRGRRQYPNSVNVLAAELHALAALGRTEELDGRLVEALTMPGTGPAEMWPPGWQATEAAMELRAHGYGQAADSTLDRVRRWIIAQFGESAAPPVQRMHLAVISYLAGDWDAARRRFQALVEESPGDANLQGYLGAIAAHQGDRDAARGVSQWLGDLRQPYLYGINTLWQARIAALLGESDRAVALLRSAFEEGLAHYGTGPLLWTSGAAVAWSHRDMDLESLRDYPPFQSLTRVRE